MTLTQAATFTRRSILAFILLIVLGTVSVIGYKIWYQYYLSTLPPVEEKPEMKFGSLPKLIFPDSTVTSSNFSYTLDTTTGGLPQTPKLLKVYFIPRTGVSLLAPEKSKKLAESLGFNNGPEILSTTEYQFTDNNQGGLTIDITTGNFFFQRQATDSAQLAATLPDQPQLVQEFKKYLSVKNLLADELSTGKSNVIFDKGSLQNPTSAQVSLWPLDIDNFPIIQAAFDHSNVSATVTKGTEEADKFLSVNYIYWPIDKTTFSTYPLKTAQQAFDDLRAGLGFVSIEPKKPQVSVSSVYLGYYESAEYSPYLQPVFVFEGPGFAAVVPAVGQNNNTATPK